jgi:cytochrome c biogenesis protein CcmG, thiol:disulfide interchange protein DsbE
MRVLRLGAYAAAVLACAVALAASPGEIAPDFTRSDLGSQPVHLAAYRGRVVLLNFWASWCTPCLAEIPRFAAWQAQYGSHGFQVIGVSMDDSVQPLRRFIEQHPVPYPVILGDAQLGQAFGGVLGLPTSYLIDPQGRIVARYAGEADLASMEGQIRTLLASLAL